MGSYSRHKYIKFSRIYLIIITLISYLPVAVVVIYSFNESKLSSVWEGFSLRWYRELFADDAMLSALLTSIALGVAACFVSAVIATLAAIGMRRARLPFKRTIEYVSSLPMMIPEIVLGMVFLVFFSLIGMRLGFVTLLIAHITFCIPYIYMQVKARLVGLDTACVDAARDLGASSLRAFFDITLPAITPALISGIFLAFAMSFDDVIISIFVTGVKVNTLPIKVYTQLKTGTTPKIYALCTLMLAITVICYVLSFVFAGAGTKKSTKNKQYKKERESK